MLPLTWRVPVDDLESTWKLADWNVLKSSSSFGTHPYLCIRYRNGKSKFASAHPAMIKYYLSIRRLPQHLLLRLLSPTEQPYEAKEVQEKSLVGWDYTLWLAILPKETVCDLGIFLSNVKVKVNQYHVHHQSLVTLINATQLLLYCCEKITIPRILLTIRNGLHV